MQQCLFLFRFLNNDAYNLSTQEFMYQETRNNNDPE